MKSWFAHQEERFVTSQCDLCSKDRLRGTAYAIDEAELSVVLSGQEEGMTVEVRSNLAVVSRRLGFTSFLD